LVLTKKSIDFFVKTNVQKKLIFSVHLHKKVQLQMLYDTHNKKGIILCQAVRCRKSKKLNNVFNGVFCHYHTGVLQSIRESLFYAKNTRNIHLEQYFRQQEIELRKSPSPGHMHYQARLEDHILEDYLSLQ